MWVIAAGMPRSGSTWQYQIISHLCEQHLNGLGVGCVGWHLLGEAEQMGKDNRPRVLKVHDQDPFWEGLLQNRAARAVYIRRDIRDVIFSLIYKWDRSFTYIVEKVVPALFATDAFWMRQQSICVQRYEEVIANPDRMITQLANYMKINIDQAEISELIEKYSFANNLKRCHEFEQQLRHRNVDLTEPQNMHLLDPITELGWNHLRDGRVGAWREYSSTEQQRILRHVCGQWLSQNGYSPY